jgi:hypothetical protein
MRTFATVTGAVPYRGARVTRTPSSALGLTIDVLAAYRLVKLVRDDRVGQPVRDWAQRTHGHVEDSKVVYLVHCPWCLSFWFGSALTLARHRWPRATEALARSLAVSALTGLVDLHLDR